MGSLGGVGGGGQSEWVVCEWAGLDPGLTVSPLPEVQRSVKLKAAGGKRRKKKERERDKRKRIASDKRAEYPSSAGDTCFDLI